MTTDYDQTISQWAREYKKTGAPVSSDFRALVNGCIRPDRYTHMLHAYPAKLLPQIPYFFMQSSLLGSGGGRIVVDPFCGSGTVLLEAALHGHVPVGADTNPLARLIARVKTQPVRQKTILCELEKVRQRARSIRRADPPPVVNLRMWYLEQTVPQLAKLRLAIRAVKSKHTREFLQVCFSVCVRKMSLADPRLSVPVRIKRSRKEKYGAHYRQLEAHLAELTETSAIERFTEIVSRNAARVDALYAVIPSKNLTTIFEDARSLDKEIATGSVDVVLTSPPYAGAQKYIRSCSLSLGWLDFAYEGELRELEKQTFGREHFLNSEIGCVPEVGIPEADELLKTVAGIYPLRAHIAQTYLHEMKRALASMQCILKPGGTAILVLGPNTICGHTFDAPSYIEWLAHRAGFETHFKLIDHIRSRGLMTKRNKTAGVISSEGVVCLRKI